MQFPGGLEKFIDNINVKERPEEVLTLFEKVIKASYGEKSEDGKYFVKSEKTTELFYSSAAYAALVVELLSDADVAADFFNSVLSRTTIDKPAES